MFCNKCGNTLPEGATFCPSCGNSLENNSGKAQKKSARNANPWSPEELKKKSILFLVMGLFLIVLSFVARTLGGVFPEQETLTKMPTFCLVAGIIILVISPIFFILSKKK